MSRLLLFGFIGLVLSINIARGTGVSPGPPVDPENWVHFTLDWSLAQWVNYPDNATEPTSTFVNVGTMEEISVIDDSFWVLRSTTPPRLHFRLFTNEGPGVDQMSDVYISPELASGIPAFTAAIGPRTSVIWNAQIAHVTRNITFTAPGYERVGMPIPEPSTLTLVACAAVGAMRRRRSAI